MAATLHFKAETVPFVNVPGVTDHIGGRFMICSVDGPVPGEITVDYAKNGFVVMRNGVVSSLGALKHGDVVELSGNPVVLLKATGV